MLFFLNSSRIPYQASVSMTLLAKIILNIICDSRSLFQNLIKNGNLNEKLTPENHQFGIEKFLNSEGIFHQIESFKLPTFFTRIPFSVCSNVAHSVA